MADSFHVRYQATPEAILAVFQVLVNEAPQSLEELRCTLEALGEKTGTLGEQLTRMRKLGLLEKNGLELTKRGQVCAQVLSNHPALFFDLLHFYHFTLWDASNPDVNRFSWTYRTVCKHLWSLTSAPVNNRTLLERVMLDLLEQFPDEYDVSLSVGTIRGVLDWVQRLQPPVYDGKRFERRPFAPPELALLAIDHFYSRQGVGYGELLALDDASFKEIAILCLVDDGVLNAMLKESEQRFPWFEIEAGWGYFVRLHQPPNLTEDL
ncbi:MAG TPA: hypothetical protein GXX19_07585 [Syntrophomonadaceae bacterium]|nr:hypothetical protein [Syntrophomonadaceae bacterium]